MSDYTQLKRMLVKHGFKSIGWNNPPLYEEEEYKWVAYKKFPVTILILKSVSHFNVVPKLLYIAICTEIPIKFRKHSTTHINVYSGEDCIVPKDMIDPEITDFLSDHICTNPHQYSIHDIMMDHSGLIEKLYVDTMNMNENLIKQYTDKYYEDSVKMSIPKLYEATLYVKCSLFRFFNSECMMINVTLNEKLIMSVTNCIRYQLLILYFKLDAELKSRCAKTLESATEKDISDILFIMPNL